MKQELGTIVALGFDTNCLQLMNSGMVCLSVGVTTLQENKSVHCTLGPQQFFPLINVAVIFSEGHLFDMEDMILNNVMLL